MDKAHSEFSEWAFLIFRNKFLKNLHHLIPIP